MSMFLIGRHTRAEEESGRDELVRAAAVGRQAPMTAAVVDALLANVALGLLRRRSAWSTYPLAVADSIALGVGLTLRGWVFTGIALVAAQLTASTRAMYGIAGAVIGVAYVLRAIGDVGDARAELALADRVVPGRCTPSPACAGGRPCSCSPAPRSRRSRRTPCSSGATSAPACWPPGPGPAARVAGLRSAARAGLAPPARRR